MRNRGKVFWGWADADLHCRDHDERVVGGKLINVQVRLSKLGATQLFVGVYGNDGDLLLEEAFESRPGESMTQAMAWGVQRAKDWLDQN